MGYKKKQRGMMRKKGINSWTTSHLQVDTIENSQFGPTVLSLLANHGMILNQSLSWRSYKSMKTR